MSQYKLRVHDDIADLLRSLHPILKKRMKKALREVLHNPYCGKALKEGLSDLRSFQIKRFRIIYKVSANKEIGIVAIGPRKYFYEETFRLISKEQRDKNRRATFLYEIRF